MLWLDTYRPELAVQDSALQRRFQQGNEVGDLAMRLLGDFVETTAYTADGGLDIPAMLKNTKKFGRNILLIAAIYAISVAVGIVINSVAVLMG